jgi:beta-lactamase class A
VACRSLTPSRTQSPVGPESSASTHATSAPARRSPVNADRILPAESAAKTFVLVHYARLVSSEAIDPAARIRLDGSTRYPGTGVLRYLADGLEPTLDDLA